ncbi:MAG: Ig-like domain-containing protein [Hymenobacteraceae bacterium]|nr:Ig-like domain-containing protein [Hymenobacteraceae bacterium]
MKLFNTLIALATLAGITSCASVSAPEGGPKDLTAPTLVNSNPKDQELKVSTRTITLTFDEEVQPNNLNKELLITPFTSNTYTVKTNRNVMSLEFENALEENTTYTLNFREGIVDITEKNKAQGLRLSFSTGDYIDSSRVSGTVVELLKQTPEKNATIALYPTNDTLSIRKNRPYYQTQTNDAGTFELGNIREGEYRIYALVDKNNNSFYDSEEERIAYLSGPIRITADTEPITLETVRIDTKRPILLQRENYLDRFIANYNEGIRSFSAAPAESPKDTIAHRIGTAGKAVEMFKSARFQGGKAILSAVDSAGNIAIDTVQIKFDGKRAQRVKGAQLAVINGAGKGAYAVGKVVKVELETQVNIKEGSAPVRILADTILLTSLKYPADVRQDATGTELSFILPNLNGRTRNIMLELDSTAIQPVQGEPLQFTRIPLTIAQNGGTGSVRGTVSSKFTSFTVQLLNQEYRVVEEVRNQKNFQFRNIEPATYQIRVLVDENNNGTWDAGDPKLEREPEKVYFYPKPIEVRANWELEAVKLEF